MRSCVNKCSWGFIFAELYHLLQCKHSLFFGSWSYLGSQSAEHSMLTAPAGFRCHCHSTCYSPGIRTPSTEHFISYPRCQNVAFQIQIINGFCHKRWWGFFLNLKSLLSFHNVLENNYLKSQFCSLCHACEIPGFEWNSTGQWKTTSPGLNTSSALRNFAFISPGVYLACLIHFVKSPWREKQPNSSLQERDVKFCPEPLGDSSSTPSAGLQTLTPNTAGFSWF